MLVGTMVEDPMPDSCQEQQMLPSSVTLLLHKRVKAFLCCYTKISLIYIIGEKKTQSRQIADLCK